MPKAVADANRRADMPAAAATCTSAPADSPSTDTRPARRPWLTLRATTYSTPGPGISRTTSAAAMKPSNEPLAGIPLRHHRGLLGDHEFEPLEIRHQGGFIEHTHLAQHR